MNVLCSIVIVESLLNFILLFWFLMLRQCITTPQMKVNWMKPPTMIMKQDKFMITYKEKMITKYHNRKEGKLLNHLTVNCAITASSSILAFQKYWYQYVNQKIQFRINSISNTLVSKLYTWLPPTNLVRMCTLAMGINPIKSQWISPA